MSEIPEDVAKAISDFRVAASHDYYQSVEGYDDDVMDAASRGFGRAAEALNEAISNAILAERKRCADIARSYSHSQDCGHVGETILAEIESGQ